MLRVGLTGGIGCGKSTVADFFAARGVPIIDTDELARELVRPGEAAHTEIVRQFGSDVLDASGALDRGKMRNRVFNDPMQRKRLEAILHPRIRTEVQRRLAGFNALYAIIAIPLLIETDVGNLADRILVVDCDESLQVRRVAARNGMESAEVRRIMTAQATREDRLAHADDVIENNADLVQLEEQVTRLHERYLTLAKDKERLTN
jgi:dephospho-CoA kinase